MTTTGHLVEGLAERYRIEREIGAGGMAIIHLAYDLRHGRRVALKVLRPELAAVIGAERFLAEIRTTANLQHPHILPLFDSGTIGGTVFYVMPFVEGESLRERLNREKQLPIDDAVRIAREVADALSYAHEHGVIHRDIKPENILLHRGHALVADFGIALAASRSDSDNRLTGTGMSLGTPHYMSPEQATGQRELDGRTDIYALGCVLYEMLTGEPPFTGPTPQSITAKVMTTAPVPVTDLRHLVPESVSSAIRAALQKIPADRPASAARFAAALEGMGPPTATALPAAPARRTGSSRLLRTAAWIALAAVTAAAAWKLGASRAATEEARVTRFVLDLPRGHALAVQRMPLAVSPDGRTIAYITRTGGNRVALRRIDQLLTRLVPGTEGARRIRFSPDGSSLIANLPGGTSRVPLDGSAAQLLVPGAPTMSDPIATPTGEIVTNRIDRYRGLSMVGARGARSRILAVPDTTQGEFEQRNPVILADGKTILYTSYGGTVSRLGIASTDSGRATILPVTGFIMALGYAEGHVIYVRAGGVLAAVPVDLGARLVKGPPVDLLEGVFTGVTAISEAWAGLSANGTLVYGRGTDDAIPVLVDADGKVTPIDTVRRNYGFPRFSPDGQRIAFAIGDGLRSDIWIYQTGTGTLTRLTSGGFNDRPEWSPDGRRIVFRSDRGARHTLWSQSIDGGDAAEQFVDPGRTTVHEGVFTPDGNAMVIRSQTDDGSNNLHLMTLSGERTLRLLVSARGQFALAPRVSPDGQYLAYSSDESGEGEIYIRRLDGQGVPSRVSVRGGTEPVWSRDGKRLFYREGRGLVAATLSGLSTAPGDPTGPEVERRDAILDGSIPFAINAVRASYDVSPDGKRFLMLLQSDEDGQIVVVVHWLTELRARLAEARRN